MHTWLQRSSMPSQVPGASSTTPNSQCGLQGCSCMSWLVSACIRSVSPRINEKGCTEREIVSGGLVASACSYQPRSDVFPPFVYVINFSLSAGGEHPCMYRLGLQARVKGTCNCVATLFSQTPGHQNPFQSGTIDQRGYSIDALPPLKYTYCTHSKFCQPLNSKLTALVRDMLQVEPTDRPSLQDCVKRVMQISA